METASTVRDEIVQQALAARRARWCQTPQERIPDVDAAVPLIDRLGIVTLFPASEEVPNLYHAYMGDPHALTSSQWDSPSGHVYTWRWTLGRRSAGFYSSLVRGRPTWVSWGLLPAVLRLYGALRLPDDLYEAGQLSAQAIRIAHALEEAQGVLTTPELRQAAGFPTGKAQRAEYLKAVDELEHHLLLAKTFAQEDEEMRHALVRLQYPAQLAEAKRLTDEQALAAVLAAYLPAAVYALPSVLARHLRVPATAFTDALDHLAAAGRARPVSWPGQKGTCYLWAERI
jgi:hypothetical protein